MAATPKTENAPDKATAAATTAAPPASVAPESPAPEAAGDVGELVLVYDRASGAILNVYDVLPSGERRELAPEESEALFAGIAEATLAAGAPETPEASEEEAIAAELDAALEHQAAGFEEGYYAGLAEYEAALVLEATGYSEEEEAAYQQGIADYHAYVTGQA